MLVRDPEAAEERFQVLLRDDVPRHGVVDVLPPVDEAGPGDVTQVVIRGRIVVDLDDSDVLVPQTTFHKARVDQDFGMRVLCHATFLGRLRSNTLLYYFRQRLFQYAFHEALDTPIGMDIDNGRCTAVREPRLHIAVPLSPSRRVARAV